MHLVVKQLFRFHLRQHWITTAYKYSCMTAVSVASSFLVVEVQMGQVYMSALTASGLMVAVIPFWPTAESQQLWTIQHCCRNPHGWGWCSLYYLLQWEQNVSTSAESLPWAKTNQIYRVTSNFWRVWASQFLTCCHSCQLRELSETRLTWKKW